MDAEAASPPKGGDAAASLPPLPASMSRSASASKHACLGRLEAAAAADEQWRRAQDEPKARKAHTHEANARRARERAKLWKRTKRIAHLRAVLPSVARGALKWPLCAGKR